MLRAARLLMRMLRIIDSVQCPCAHDIYRPTLVHRHLLFSGTMHGVYTYGLHFIIITLGAHARGLR